VERLESSFETALGDPALINGELRQQICQLESSKCVALELWSDSDASLSYWQTVKGGAQQPEAKSPAQLREEKEGKEEVVSN